MLHPNSGVFMSDDYKRIGRRLLRVCLPTGGAQVIALIVGMLGAWIAIYFGLYSASQRPAAYEATLLTGTVGFAFYASWAVGRESLTIVQERRRRPIPTMEQVRERELLETITSWLEQGLSDRKLHIQRAFLFGSVIHDHYSTNDVDLAVVLHSKANKQRAGDRLRNTLAVEFKRRFGHRLHLKFCNANEIAEFLRHAGAHQEISVQSKGFLAFLRASDTATHHEN